jgi:hypothetical protein
LWPKFNQSDVDLSKTFESQIHSFSGSSSQKSQATVAWSSKIDFIPKEIPNLDGLILGYCNLSVLKNELFSADFGVLEYLDRYSNQIVSIETFRFP